MASHKSLSNESVHTPSGRISYTDRGAGLVALFVHGVRDLSHGAADSQLADDLHEVVHFSVHGRPAHSQVLLHADAGEEGQDHLSEQRWFHFGLLGLDVSRD
jgi:hypothetical protein